MLRFVSMRASIDLRCQESLIRQHFNSRHVGSCDQPISSSFVKFHPRVSTRIRRPLAAILTNSTPPSSSSSPLRVQTVSKPCPKSVINTSYICPKCVQNVSKKVSKERHKYVIHLSETRPKCIQESVQNSLSPSPPSPSTPLDPIQHQEVGAGCCCPLPPPGGSTATTGPSRRFRVESAEPNTFSCRID